MPAAEAQFLTYTSVLDRMSGGLCDAVLETTGSAQTLETLGRANGFVVPLDRRGEWYRYHHLFGQLLRTSSSAASRTWCPRSTAVRWPGASTTICTEEALAYGHAAGETSTVAGLVDALALPVYYDGRLETLEEWLGWFSEESWRGIRRSPSTGPGCAC